jgi:hypothetical protein
MKIGAFFNPEAAPAVTPGRPVPPQPVDARPLMGLALFDKQQRCKYEMLAGEAQQLTRVLKDVTITNVAGAGQVNDALVQVKSLLGEIEGTRKLQTKPLKDQAKSIEDQWRPHAVALEELRALLDRKLVIWTQAERERISREQAEARRVQEDEMRRQADALRWREEALAKADAAEDEQTRAVALASAQAAAAVAETASVALTQARMAEPMEVPHGIRSDSGTSGLVENWTFKLLDFDKVPREWLTLDEVKIRAAVRGKGGVRDIPGLAIYAEESLTTRRRS